MMQAPPPTSLNGSGLIRAFSVFADSAGAQGASSPRYFAERLGNLIDLPASIALAAAHGNLATMTSEGGAGTGAAFSGASASEEFLGARTAMMQSIVDSFAPAASASRSSFPRVSAATVAKEAASYAHYRLFYLAQQKALSRRVDGLRASIRAALAAHSNRLAGLAALDETLDETLSAPAQRLFAEVPRLLGQRFELLYQRHRETTAGQAGEDDPLRWGAAGGWLEQFAAEMRAVLLAELDTRLQPLIGLLEALDEEVERN
ncbi:MAG: hypothetical protein AW11_00329 [Candidatus Accumulibacter regalis]|uniref:DUF3348 domain-containing protein n=1 Tax=Accumulibacter regalis TaxID=522306 RepID=A0A011P7S0_ACCRE|nr:DUF3348 family protein [Accumulibacter sp.]EXI90988.1 MAG: hypothetical protein AW11_00329 [Candidatus Accumulibacter regalis]MBN8513895.1 DUF3348 family protein [Accumulibacter sp.]MBO3703572.1 DUF3348 family protein [Accumulibacter sp.]HRE69468.1 DUF3348 family protein [Accumulibacter sp.]